MGLFAVIPADHHLWGEQCLYFTGKPCHLEKSATCPFHASQSLLSPPWPPTDPRGGLALVTQGHPGPGTRDQLWAKRTHRGFSALALGPELFAERQLGSPFLSGSLQFKDIKVPVVSVSQGLS